MNRQYFNNKGLTLIELIVVVAVIAIVSAGGITGFGMIYNTSAKETAAKLESALKKARTDAMSRSQASMELYKDNNEYFVKYTINGNEEAPIRIGSSRVEIAYEESTGAKIPLTSLVIVFDRQTGGLKPIRDDIYCKKITVASGSRNITLILERLTGKIRIE